MQVQNDQCKLIWSCDKYCVTAYKCTKDMGSVYLTASELNEPHGLFSVICISHSYYTLPLTSQKKLLPFLSFRELILLHSDIVASPVLGHYGGIAVIMTVSMIYYALFNNY